MNETPCPFCTIDVQRIFYSGELVVGIWDMYPVSPGHALLLPKRHISSWFEATAEERAELSETTTIAREAILKRTASEHLPTPDGFNIGVNVGQSAGQTVFHLHVHVIPRCSGDVVDPRGGVRHVIPNKAQYLGLADRVALTRDDQRWSPSGYPSRRREQLVTGGLDNALLHPLLEDLDAAHQIDIAVAFALESGMDLIYAHLREVLERGGEVRFLTGDYMDATAPDALRRLLDLQGNIQRRVFESTNQSFHPKTYIFVERSGIGVAYVGSSNLTNLALTHGIEWNYRVSNADNPSGFAEVSQAFTKLSCTRRLGRWMNSGSTLMRGDERRGHPPQSTSSSNRRVRRHHLTRFRRRPWRLSKRRVVRETVQGWWC